MKFHWTREGRSIQIQMSIYRYGLFIGFGFPLWRKVTAGGMDVTSFLLDMCVYKLGSK